MSAQHTPGPLWVESSVYDGFAAAVVGRIEVEGHAARETRTLAHFRRLPDAVLYAAAPEMLAVLKELLDIEGPCPGTAAWATRARAIIANIEGES